MTNTLVRQVIPFTTEEEWLAHRMKDLTSSDIPVLFGYGYMTYYELKNSKSLEIKHELDMNERMRWGIALQDGIASEFARQNDWTIRKKTEYIRIPELRLGSSFDFSIMSECGTNSEDITMEETALLEIKNVDSLVYKRDWKHGFMTEATPYIELQLQHQLLVSGLDKAYIGVLVGGNQGVCLPREANKKIQDAILLKAAKFWREVDESK